MDNYFWFLVSNFWFLVVFCFAKIFSPLGIAQTSLALLSLVEKILKIAIAIFVSKFLLRKIFAPLGIVQTSLTLRSLIAKILALQAGSKFQSCLIV